MNTMEKLFDLVVLQRERLDAIELDQKIFNEGFMAELDVLRHKVKCSKQKKPIIWHGGCHGCIQQLIQPEGILFCERCKYYISDWDLPSLYSDTDYRGGNYANRY